MKALKRVLLGVLSVACIFATAVAFTSCEDGAIGEDGFRYSLLDDGTYAVSIKNNYFGKLKGDIVLPSSYEGKAVTSVGEGDFGRGNKITSITIPDSVTSVGNYAFSGCDSLTSVVIPDSVTSIGEWAFYNCSSLTNVVIGDSVTSIGQAAFYNCSSLSSVVISDSVTSIGLIAFYNCRSLTSVYITNIESWCTISGLYNLMNYNSSNKKLYLNNELVTDLVIPDSVTSIGDGAFCYCRSLKSITVSEDNTAYQSIDGNLYSKDGKTLVQYAIGKTEPSFAIPDGVTSVAYGAFCANTNLTNVTIPDSVTSIGEYAFSGCYNLTSVTCPAFAISYIPKGNLQTVVITSGEAIGAYAFQYCSELTSIVIPNSVTSIGVGAFDSCISLKNVYYKGSANDWSLTSISSYNYNLTKATRYYYSESQPMVGGICWHYDENGEVVVW